MESPLKRLVGQVICVDGNIGAGKTTLIAAMKKHLDLVNVPAVVVEERFDSELLELFNLDPPRYALMFQESMMINRLLAAAKARRVAEGGSVALVDTGMLREIAFSYANYAEENITALGFHNHMANYLSLFASVGSPYPDHFVLLDASAKRCKENIMARNRANEASTLKFSYLEHISEEYRKAMTNSLVQHTSIKSYMTVNVEMGFPRAELILHVLNQAVPGSRTIVDC